jgi:hypothetical protein
MQKASHQFHQWNKRRTKMKTRKHNIIGIAAIIALALIAGCGNGNGKTDPQCECTVKVHPFGSPCACPVAGTSACDCIEEVQREFTITIPGYEEHPVTVVDTRTYTGLTDQDLAALGVISRLTAALTTIKEGGSSRFDPVINRDVTILVEEIEYEYSAPANKYSGNKLGINFAYISGDAENLVAALEYYITAEMYDDNTLD